MVPQTPVIFFKEADGSIPFVEWYDELPSKVQAKCRVRIERLKEQGNELRRPEADFLRDGIYEIRVRHRRENYRVLYFFHEHSAVLSHGIKKEKVVPSKEIDTAVERKKAFSANPKKHTMEE